MELQPGTDTKTLPAEPEGPRKNFLAAWDWRHILFYLGVPLVVAVYAAVNNWAILELVGYSGTIVFYLGHAFVPWWTTALVTWASMQLLKPWKPAPVVIWSIGTLIACFIVLPYSEWLTTAFVDNWLPADSGKTAGNMHLDSDVSFWSFFLRASVIWLAVNFVFDRFLNFPRYRYPGDPRLVDSETQPDTQSIGRDPAADGEPEPRFLQRLPVNIAVEDIIAIKAEQHYVKVFTPEKSFMTLYRFSDAVAEMGNETGQQVHRSYWVRADAISAVKRESRKYSVELSNGMLVPISAPNRGLIRQMAQRRNIPIHPPL